MGGGRQGSGSGSVIDSHGRCVPVNEDANERVSARKHTLRTHHSIGIRVTLGFSARMDRRNFVKSGVEGGFSRNSSSSYSLRT